MPWNPRQPSIFHDESWPTPWRSSEFPPEETFVERINRQHANPEWESVPHFLYYESGRSGGWPWGWAIYRTSYLNTSDQDWTRAIEKLDEACMADLEFYERSWHRFDLKCVEMVREGYRNVIFEDPALEGASEAVIQRRHNAAPRKPSVIEQGLPWPKINDKPGGMVGYVNFIDSHFRPEDPENEYGEYYRGLVRVHLDCLAQFGLFCEDLETGEQGWGEYGMDTPDYVFYTDGHCSKPELKEMFLSSPDRNVKRTASVTELEYIERQDMENLALSNVPGST
ncbi:uncharacterized protein N7518_006203 [Penicillium psychrosexuale]|uniref:uncharacterized protein n=1 Tax=Penicillium psychrosexuale TaxID=1002107 RepID=UPI002544E3A8|nr:uncharacterized protein N7518_006203 [Penicillium psychrosexuale]KAJ5789192.1 hypothetical protein N7518_006203 [Penicillium psychrosexuale]